MIFIELTDADNTLSILLNTANIVAVEAQANGCTVFTITDTGTFDVSESYSAVRALLRDAT